MPEIDPDLYSIVTLILLLVIAVALVGIASALSAIKKSLEHQLPTTMAKDERPAHHAAAPAAEGPGTYGGYTPTEQAATGTTSPVLGVEPAGGTAAAAAATPATAAPHQTAYAEARPAADTETPPAAHAEAQPVTTAGAEPEEQPFERDGRWWFRRGDELLVYDERSGQWVAAPEGAAGGAPAAGVPHTTGGATEAQAASAGGPAEGGFWKCPSCGAVNGSTATTCRMCFTARP